MTTTDAPQIRLRSNLASSSRPMHLHLAGTVGTIVESIRPHWWKIQLDTSSWSEIMVVHEDDFEVIQEAVG